MRILALVLAVLLQSPDPPRIVPAPLASVPRAQAILKGLRLIDVRPEGAVLIGSACPIGGFGAYTAAHVVDDVKGHLVALPNFGYNADEHSVIPVRVGKVDKEKDLAMIMPESGDTPFPTWFPRGPVPVAGAEVRGILWLPGDNKLAVPTFGAFYGESDGWLWASIMLGPGSSGACVLDDHDRVFAVSTATGSWGNEMAHPANLPRAAVMSRIPEK